jgi:carbon-monoxide dehydrogenase medium subunit
MAWAGPQGVRVAAGGIGPHVMRLTQVEQVVAGGLNSESIEGAVAATTALIPLPDFRGSTEYRRAMLGVLVRRVLADLWKSA